MTVPAIPSVSGKAVSGAGIHTKGGAQEKDYFAAVFAVLLTAITRRITTINFQANGVKENADAQDALNQKNANIPYTNIPAGTSQDNMNKIMAANQQQTENRENIQNELVTCRQKGQIEMTQTSTNVNLMEQNTSEDSNWLHIESSIVAAVNQMNR